MVLARNGGQNNGARMFMESWHRLMVRDDNVTIREVMVQLYGVWGVSQADGER